MPSEVRKIRYSIGCKNEERIHISVWKMHTTLLTQSLHIDKSRFTYWLFAGDSVGRVRAYIPTEAFLMHFVLVRVSTHEHVNVLVWEDNLLLQI